MKKNLTVGQKRISDLVKTYKTPLIIYDQNILDEQIDTFKNAFSSTQFAIEILYASKAASILGLYRIFNQAQFAFDVVSSGEAFVCLKAGINPSKIYFHGNNKTTEELEYIIDHSIGTIIVDNFTELLRINELVLVKKQKIDILLRVNPHINAGAHEKIATAVDDSKFGISIYSSFAWFMKIIEGNQYLKFRGFHAHIGSQITNFKPYQLLIDTLDQFVMNFKTNHPKIDFDTLNFGGGFGVKYTNENFDLNSFLKRYIKEMEIKFSKYPFIKRIMIEPGRSLIGPAGITVYTVGGFKTTASQKTHLYVDGGMTDNIRPTLYDAQYTFALNRQGEKLHNYIISGKCCESGDVLSHSYQLPQAQVGDLLIAYMTGAYTYAMASNYNQLRKPAVILIDKSNVKLLARRETYEDLIRLMD